MTSTREGSTDSTLHAHLPDTASAGENEIHRVLGTGQGKRSRCVFSHSEKRHIYTHSTHIWNKHIKKAHKIYPDIFNYFYSTLG